MLKIIIDFELIDTKCLCQKPSGTIGVNERILIGDGVELSGISLVIITSRFIID